MRTDFADMTLTLMSWASYSGGSKQHTVSHTSRQTYLGANKLIYLPHGLAKVFMALFTFCRFTTTKENFLFSINSNGYSRRPAESYSSVKRIC